MEDNFINHSVTTAFMKSPLLLPGLAKGYMYFFLFLPPPLFFACFVLHFFKTFIAFQHFLAFVFQTYVICHMSIIPTATAEDPPPAISPIQINSKR